MVLTSFWSKNRWNKIIQNELNWPNKYDHRTQSSVKLLLQWFFHHSLPGPSPFSLRGNNIDDVDDDDDRDDDKDDEQEDDIDKEDDEYNEDGDSYMMMMMMAMSRSEMTLKTAVGTPVLNRSRETKIG